MKIIIKPINQLSEIQSNDLVSILNFDKKLKKELKSQRKNITIKDFVEYNKKWAIKNNAQIFAIVLKNKAIGSISLSYISMQNKTARIGYWLASDYWSKGYVSQAFKLILDLAKKMKLENVSSTIEKENKASRRIWEKYQAQFTEKNNKIIPIINL